MAVGLKVRSIIWFVGHRDFLHSFFSTASGKLEPDGWGSRFPAVMNGLFQGKLPAEQVAEGIRELHQIHEELARFPPEEVIWDIADLTAKPPWGDDISPTITDLSNYFVTADGKDLFGVLDESLNYAASKPAPVTIESGV